MTNKSPYLFKIATTKDEIQQIHQLNYETFVEEIPQHEKNESRILVDPFHALNTYLIAIKDHQVIGMIAINNKRPFSLDKKLGNIDHFLPIPMSNLCEVRLLAVQKEYRKTTVFIGLMRLLYQYFIDQHYDGVVISGTTRELKLYKHMGFLPFAHLVGKENAWYQPMYLSKEKVTETKHLYERRISFLPGPIEISEQVKNAFYQDVIPHRDTHFKQLMTNTQNKLCQLTHSKYVQILVGTGTLANDCIAAQISLLHEKGLILSNGEFGDRLIERAQRFRLPFVSLKKNWGEPIFEEDIIHLLDKDIKWIWYVHCETSTGVLNSMEIISRICKKFSLKHIVDCISSIGALPIDLTDIYLASGVSGKAIGSVSGLSFVFHQHPIVRNNMLPPYLDLGEYYEKHSIPFTHSSYLLHALNEALSIDFVKRYEEIKSLYFFTTDYLEKEGFSLLIDKTYAAYPIITICFDSSISSRTIGDLMKWQGYIVHYESNYLDTRNWVQLATIGTHSKKEMNNMLQTFSALYQYLLKRENYTPINMA